MSKAFENVNHPILLNKLTAKGVPSFIVNKFQWIFSRSEIRVCFNDCFSDSWRICRGVRQGGVTSAILFNIYIDDILSEISANNIGCRLGISKVNIQAHADDVALLSPTPSGLQK